MFKAILIGYLFIIIACNNNPTRTAFKAFANDTIVLIQSLLDNKMLYDSLFSEQISQNLIIHKDQHIPLNTSFTYNSKPATIQVTKFKPSDIDIDHPRFLIAVGKVAIKDSSAVLDFIMPDVGLGISTNWMRSKQTDPWKLIDWSIEHY